MAPVTDLKGSTKSGQSSRAPKSMKAMHRLKPWCITIPANITISVQCYLGQGRGWSQAPDYALIILIIIFITIIYINFIMWTRFPCNSAATGQGESLGIQCNTWSQAMTRWHIVHSLEGGGEVRMWHFRLFNVLVIGHTKHRGVKQVYCEQFPNRVCHKYYRQDLGFCRPPGMQQWLYPVSWFCVLQQCVAPVFHGGSQCYPYDLGSV